MLLLAIAPLLVLSTLGCSPSGPPPGTERGPCLPSGGCDVGLVCRSGLCVRDVLPDAGEADAGAPTDTPLAPDAGPRSVSETWVVSGLTLPTSGALATELGFDVDGNGANDNALGQILAALGSAAGSSDVQLVLDQWVAEGTDIDLVAVATTPSATVGALAWLEGTSPMPTPCDGTGACGLHLAGTGRFTIAGETVWRTASVSGSAVFADRAPPTIEVPVSFLGEPPTLVPVTRPLLEIDGDRGRIGGVVRQTDLQTTVLPSLASSLGAVVDRDCPGGACTAGSIGATILDLFDTDADGTVTLEELETNGVISAVLAPDLDVEDASGMPGSDGTPESVSMAVGLRLAGATFDVVP